MLNRCSSLALVPLFVLVALVSPGLATDYDVVNEDIWPSQNDVAQTAGNGKKLLENQWQEAIIAITETNYVYAGCALPASSANLNISVPSCQALINGRFVDIPGSTTITASASSTNHVYLKFVRDGASLATGAKFEVNATGTAPADSVKIGTLVASGSAITSTTDQRRMGMPAVFRGPWAVGAGSTRSHEGSVTITSNQDLSGVHFYTDFTLNSGVTLTVPAGKRGVKIVASGTITINGTINASGAGGFQASLSDKHFILSSGTDQPGGGGAGSGTSNAGGPILRHGAIAAEGGAASTAGTQQIGSDVLVEFLSAMGGSGGGAASDGTNTDTGGKGGGSIVLIAPTVVLASTATLNTSGTSGTSVWSHTGGGGAGNVYIATRSYIDNGATFIQTGGAATGGTAGAGAAGVKQSSIY